ncbi:hypothetical protein glysoja_013286 [Glycine soja]|nr:hypothetical protein glysoja_013286 [Glycine soja]
MNHCNKHSSHHHNRESHGLNSDNTSVDDVRAPNVFEPAKEEFQGLAEVFHHKIKALTSDIRNEDQIVESSEHNQESPSSPPGIYVNVWER